MTSGFGFVLLGGLTVLAAQTGQCIGRVCDTTGLNGICKDYYELHSSRNLWAEYWSNGGSMGNSISSVAIQADHEVSLCKSTSLFGPCTTLQGGSGGYSYNLSSIVDNNGQSFDKNVQSFEFRTTTIPWDQSAYQPTYPTNRTYCGPPSGKCLEESPQGVAHDDENWYFTNQWYIFKIPLSTDLTTINNIQSYAVRGLPQDCGHFGDLDYYNGKLYIPVEDCPWLDSYCPKDGSHEDCRLYIYSAQNPGAGPEKYVRLARGNYIGYSHIAWVSVHPETGLVFTQWAFAQGSTLYPWVDVYPDISNVPNGSSVKEDYWLDTFLQSGAAFTVRRVQGGKITRDNYLYLVSDDNQDRSRAGIYTFKVKERRADLLRTIGPNGYVGGEEMEGIDVVDVAGKGIPGIPNGQIHWLLGNDGHDIWFKHIYVYVFGQPSPPFGF